MDLLRTIQEFRAARAALPSPVALVPTMGYLHAGHLALVERARAENAVVAVRSSSTPPSSTAPMISPATRRDLDRDLALLDDAGVTLVFAPTREEMYPATYSTTVRVARVSELEGAHRAGHFDGVATVVCKLFNIVQPDRAYFGQKDAQQVVVVRRMVADLNLPVEVITVPTVRERDGLALSSRNVFLEGEARQHALALSRHWLPPVPPGSRASATRTPCAPPPRATSPPRRVCGWNPLSLAHPDTLEGLHGPIERGLMSTAAWVGTVRLIDNLVLG